MRQSWRTTRGRAQRGSAPSRSRVRPKGRHWIALGLLAGLAAPGLLGGRAAGVQLVQGRRWAEEARAQRTERIVLAPRRGTLWDRHGTPLALTQETYHVGIAPNELRDSVADGALIRRRLGLPARHRLQGVAQRDAHLAGPHPPPQPQPLPPAPAAPLAPFPN